MLDTQNIKPKTFTLLSSLTGDRPLARWGDVREQKRVEVDLSEHRELAEVSGPIEFRLYLHGGDGNPYESFGIGDADRQPDVELVGSVRPGGAADHPQPR